MGELVGCAIEYTLRENEPFPKCTMIMVAPDEHTLRENEKAFSRITIRPRILVDVSSIDMSANILGYSISASIMVAPTAMHKLAHPDGELATARAAAACNNYGGILLSHLQRRRGRREVTTQLVQRAERNGYKAIVLTVDTPRLGRREADIKNKMVSPQLKNLEGLVSTEISPEEGSGVEALALRAFDQSLNWKDIDWLRSITKLPILIKGVLTREDATKAVEVGVDGIIVSNHGARQLDYVLATISALEEYIARLYMLSEEEFPSSLMEEFDVERTSSRL